MRKTLRILSRICPKISIVEVPSGSKVFDWIVPYEWIVNEAWIKNSEGKKIANFANNNLHVIGYSQPIDKKISLNELNKNLYSLPDQPKAIPYVTSYYKKRWGFCIQDNIKKKLKSEKYRVNIDSKYKKD